MRAGDFLEVARLPDDMLKLRVVIKHVDGPGMLEQRIPEISKRAAQSRFWKRIKKVNHQRILRQGKRRCIRAKALDRETLLRIAFVTAKVLPADLIERGKKFYSDDAPR